MDPLESLTALVRRLEGVHRAQPENGVIARELRQSLVALAGLAPSESMDPLESLREFVAAVP